jgi:hypothetical protein
LEWAEWHHERTEQWLNQTADPVTYALGESWKDINSCLQRGFCGLPGGDSLALLIKSGWGCGRTAGHHGFSGFHGPPA